jgi:3',5'-cyclic AMP phosphodiesterase CpdA
MRRFLVILAAVGAIASLRAGQQPQLRAIEPLEPAHESVKFAVIGDNGNGEPVQYDVGRQMDAAHGTFPFEFVIMMGDNLYGRQQPEDFVQKFERPYAPLLAAGVPFYAALGNHDKPTNRDYKPFNMGGARYYTFVKKYIRFVVLDTNLLDDPQIEWAKQTLDQAREPWVIVYFHHPLYSDGERHGSNVELRVVLEPLLVRSGVRVVFSGHEHIYQRTRPQKGISYFIEGSSGQLRKGGAAPTALNAVAFDQDQTFMLVDITGDEMAFRTVSRTGRVVDSGVIQRRSGT